MLYLFKTNGNIFLTDLGITEHFLGEGLALFHPNSAKLIIVATGGGGAKVAAWPPPPPPQIGDHLRSIQIRGNFGVGKKWGRFSALRQFNIKF